LDREGNNSTKNEALIVIFEHDFFTSFIWGYLHTKFEVLFEVYAYRELWPAGKNELSGPERVRKSPVLIALTIRAGWCLMYQS